MYNKLTNICNFVTFEYPPIQFQISMAVCSILYQLAIRPEQQEKLYQELKMVIPDPNTKLNAKMLDEMVFLKAFVKEVFR